MHCKTLGIILLVILLPSLFGCATTDPSVYGPDAYIIRGTIHYREIEGGCWQCVSENGKSYELVCEDSTVPLKDGVYAEMIVRNSENASTICMIGIIVEVIEIIHLSSL